MIHKLYHNYDIIARIFSKMMHDVLRKVSNKIKKKSIEFPKQLC